MSDVAINQILARMQVLRAQAQGIHESPAVTQSPQTDFAKALNNAVAHVNTSQQEASKMTQAFEAGDPNVNLAQVMVASQKAGIEFQSMTAVRNKMVQAYHDIMNMPI